MGTVRVIYANYMICCTAAGLPHIVSFVVVKFFFNPSTNFWDGVIQYSFLNSVASKCQHVSCLSLKSITLIQIVKEQK